jgi:hypothetical protein
MAAPFTTSGADNIAGALVRAYVSTKWQPLFTMIDPLFKVLFSDEKKIKRGWGNGLSFFVSVPASGPSNVNIANSASAYAALTFTDTDALRLAEYTAHEEVRPVAIQTLEWEQQKGPEARCNYLQGILDANLKSYMEVFRTALWAAGETANSGGYVARGTTSARAPFGSILTYINGGTAATVTDGLTPAERTEQLGNRAVCSASNQTAVLSVGNISRAQSGGGRWTPPIITTSQNVTATVISNIYRKASTDETRPNLGITTEDVWAKLESVALMNGSAWPGFSKGNSVNLGWETIRYMDMDIVYSQMCPGVAYLNGATTAYDDQFLALTTDFLSVWQDAATPTIKDVANDGRPIEAWTIRHCAQLTMASAIGHARHVYLNPAG